MFTYTTLMETCVKMMGFLKTHHDPEKRVVVYYISSHSVYCEESSWRLYILGLQCLGNITLTTMLLQGKNSKSAAFILNHILIFSIEWSILVLFGVTRIMPRPNFLIWKVTKTIVLCIWKMTLYLICVIFYPRINTICDYDNEMIIFPSV